VRRLFVFVGLVAACGLAVAQEKDTELSAKTRKAVMTTKITVDWKDALMQDIARELKEKLEEDGKVKCAVKVDSLITGLTQNMKITYSAKDKTIHQILDEMGKKFNVGYVIVGKTYKGKYKKDDGTLLLTKSDERGFEMK
jgi:predicted RND superfamily exporter protein